MKQHGLLSSTIGNYSFEYEPGVPFQSADLVDYLRMAIPSYPHSLSILIHGNGHVNEAVLGDNGQQKSIPDSRCVFDWIKRANEKLNGTDLQFCLNNVKYAE